MATTKKILLIGLFLSEKNKDKILRSSADRLAEMFTKNNIEVITVSDKIGRLPRLFHTVSIIIGRSKEYDIAMLPIFGGLSLVLESILSRLLRFMKKKVIMVVRGGAIPDNMKTNARYYLPVFNRADVVVAPSGFIQSELQSYGVSCIQIENVINLGEYHFNAKEVFRPRLFWMRTFEDVYNPEMAVRVAAILVKKYPDFFMVMAGHDMGLLQPTKDLAQSLGISKHIQFLGYVGMDEKNRMATDLDFYICTNRIDNAPVSLTEVMALGMPIVTVNSGGIPYLVTHNYNAHMVNLDDDEGMANGIINIIENAAYGHALVANGFKYSRQFGEQPVMKKWVDLFEHHGYKSNIKKKYFVPGSSAAI